MHSSAGRVDVDWKKNSDGSYNYTVSIPKGIRATLVQEGMEPIKFVGNGKNKTFTIR